MNKKQVKKILKENGRTWDEFAKYMYGQTVGIKNGEFDYYKLDVNRFIQNLAPFG